MWQQLSTVRICVVAALFLALPVAVPSPALAAAKRARQRTLAQSIAAIERKPANYVKLPKAHQSEPRVLEALLANRGKERKFWKKLQAHPEVLQFALDHDLKPARALEKAPISMVEQVTLHPSHLEREPHLLWVGPRSARKDPQLVLAAAADHLAALSLAAPELVLDRTFQADIRALGRHMKWPLERAISMAGYWRREDGRRRAAVPTTDTPVGSIAQRYGPREVLYDLRRYGHLQVFAPTHLDAVNFHKLTEGRILPRDLVHLYDAVAKLADELGIAPGLAVKVNKLAITNADISWKAMLTLPGTKGKGKLEMALKRNMLYHDTGKLTAMSGRRIWQVLHHPQTNLAIRLGKEEGMLDAGLSLGPYVWAKDGWHPRDFISVRDNAVQALAKRKKALAKRSISEAVLERTLAKMAACETARELSQVAFDAEGGFVELEGRRDLSELGLKKTLRPGPYRAGMIALLNGPGYWASKSYPAGFASPDYRETLDRHVQAIVQRVNLLRKAQNEEPLDSEAIQRLKTRLQHL